jgi:hypothetical protein
MPMTFARFVPLLLAALAPVMPPGKALAGPPEGTPGEMVLDKVEDGLRKYRKEQDIDRRRVAGEVSPDPRPTGGCGDRRSPGDVCRISGATCQRG